MCFLVGARTLSSAVKTFHFRWYGLPTHPHTTSATPPHAWMWSSHPGKPHCPAPFMTDLFPPLPGLSCPSLYIYRMRSTGRTLHSPLASWPKQAHKRWPPGCSSCWPHWHPCLGRERSRARATMRRRAWHAWCAHLGGRYPWSRWCLCGWPRCHCRWVGRRMHGCGAGGGWGLCRCWCVRRDFAWAGGVG